MQVCTSAVQSCAINLSGHFENVFFFSLILLILEPLVFYFHWDAFAVAFYLEIILSISSQLFEDKVCLAPLYLQATNLLKVDATQSKHLLFHVLSSFMSLIKS